MEKLTAICGLNCFECEAFIATKNNDDQKKKEIADKWSQLYKVSILPENINCVGCIKEGAHIGYCSKCEVRKCGLAKKVDNCAFCSEYPDCTTLNAFFKMAPEEGARKIKRNLEEIKNSI